MFRILTVCSGNLCRSPLAEQLLRTRLADLPIFGVASAGTTAVVGAPMPEPAAELSTRFGGDPSQHQARQISAPIIDHADLVLVASREHRGAVVTLAPRASRKTFTIREFARLAAAGDTWAGTMPNDPRGGDDLAGLVAELAARRGAVVPEAPEDDDIIDPYQREDAIYELSASQMLPAIDVIVAALRKAVVRP